MAPGPLDGRGERLARFPQQLEAQLVQATFQAGRLAVLLVDLDRFKEINDTFGQHYGDRVLQRIGPRFQGVLGPDDMVARLGGDEFGVLLPGADRARAAAVAEEVLAAIGEPMIVGGHRLDVGGSTGRPGAARGGQPVGLGPARPRTRRVTQGPRRTSSSFDAWFDRE